MNKLYKIVNGFIDVHTGKPHSIDDDPISLTDERVKEIETTEKLLDYKLIEEVKTSTEKESKDKDSKK